VGLGRGGIELVGEVGCGGRGFGGHGGRVLEAEEGR
jgi:hypothetical protein